MPAFVSRGGAKLWHALARFELNVKGFVCADLGCSTGGFTDCLLKAGAARVYAVDTGYGILAWSLRNDERVTVMERTNALYAPRPAVAMDLVVIDAGWTPQKLILPAAMKWLKPEGRIVTLIKPHYEDKATAAKHQGILPDDLAERAVRRTLEGMSAMGLRVARWTPSPIRGSGGKGEGSGNMEWLALLERA